MRLAVIFEVVGAMSILFYSLVQHFQHLQQLLVLLVFCLRFPYVSTTQLAHLERLGACVGWVPGLAWSAAVVSVAPSAFLLLLHRLLHLCAAIATKKCTPKCWTPDVHMQTCVQRCFSVSSCVLKSGAWWKQVITSFQRASREFSVPEIQLRCTAQSCYRCHQKLPDKLQHSLLVQQDVR